MARHQKLQNRDERAQAGLRASFLGLFCNALLAAGKMLAGLVSGSVSILADGINNLSDTASVLISWFSLRVAQKPGDREHPFGHGRMEYIGTLFIALLIGYVGIDLMKSSVTAILHPAAPKFSWWLAALTAIGIPVKLGMWWYYRKQGKAFHISSLLAAAQDSINDVLITSAVLLGFLLSHFFKLTLDGWLGALVSVFILFSGYQLIRDTVTALIGGKPDKELGNKILAIIKKHPEIIGVHDFVIHEYGPGRSMASVHVEVPSSASLLDIHEVVDLIEQQVQEQLQLPITIHMDPVLPEDAPGQQVKASIAQFLAGMNPPLTLHDFRIVPGKKASKLVFDVAVPADYQNPSLTEQISQFARSLDARYTCVIRIDRDYFISHGADGHVQQ